METSSRRTHTGWVLAYVIAILAVYSNGNEAQGADGSHRKLAQNTGVESTFLGRAQSTRETVGSQYLMDAEVDDDLFEHGRSILQFTNDTNQGESSGNGDSYDMVCCCPVGSGQYKSYEYVDPPPSDSCCCDTTSVCTQCSESDSFNSVCGSGQVCGILLLMATLIGTLALTICVTGVFLARRRRQRNATLDQFVSGVMASGSPQIQRDQVINISEDQLKELYITQVPQGEHRGEIKECPICLDSVPVENGIWSTFPCGHGSCTICVNDLLRHSSRRVNSTTSAVLCPLCRTLAVAPMDGSNEPRIQIHDVNEDIDEEGEREETGENDTALDREIDGLMNSQHEEAVEVVEDVEELHDEAMRVQEQTPISIVIVDDDHQPPEQRS